MNTVKKIGVSALAVMICLQMISCGTETKESIAIDKSSSEEDFVYVADFQELEGKYSVSTACFGKEDTFYFIDVKEDSASKLFQAKIGLEEKIEIPLDTQQMDVTAIRQDADGNLILVLMKANEEAAFEEAVTSIEKAEIRKIEPSGKELFRTDITNICNKYPDFYVQSVECDKDGNYYLNAGNKILILKQDGNLLSENATQGNDYFSDIFRIRDGRVIASYYSSNGMQKLVDANGLKELNYKLDFGYGCYQGGTDTDIMYTQDNALYSCNLTDEKPTKILTLSDCDIDSSSPRAFTMLSDGRIAIFSMSYIGSLQKAELAVISQKKRSEIPEKTVLTYGTFYIPYYTSKDITDFNKQSDKYRIEVKEYGDDNSDYQTKLNLLNAEIASGKGPDILDLNYSADLAETYASSGVLEDLYPYLEKDELLSKDDFIDNVLKAYEIDGKLIGIMSNFSVQTLVGKVSDIGNSKSWTIDDMIALADSKPEDAQFLQYVTKDSMLNILCTMNESLFVNSETGECNFTSEEFKKVLDFSNRFPKEVAYDPNGPSQMELIRNGKLILIEQPLTSVTLYQMYEYMFNEPVNFVGYPSSNGSGTVIQPNGTTLGMNAASSNKEGVWEFIHFLLEEGRQELSLKANGGFSVSKEALQKQFEIDMTPEYYENSEGIRKEKPKSTWGGEDYSVDVYAATKEQTDRVIEIIENADSRCRMDNKIFEIIREEAQAYFEGQKPFEDVAGLIQNRVQTYVNESR